MRENVFREHTQSFTEQLIKMLLLHWLEKEKNPNYSHFEHIFFELKFQAMNSWTSVWASVWASVCNYVNVPLSMLRKMMCHMENESFGETAYNHDVSIDRIPVHSFFCLSHRSSRFRKKCLYAEHITRYLGKRRSFGWNLLWYGDVSAAQQCTGMCCALTAPASDPEPALLCVCVCGLLHVPSMLMWAFFRFSGFLQPPTNMQVGGLAIANGALDRMWKVWKNKYQWWSSWMNMNGS